MALEPLKKVYEKYILPTARFEAPRVTVLGTVGSGKTTVLGCLVLTCTDLANDPKTGLKLLVDEKTSGILEVPSRLRDGRFPARTPEGCTFEADVLLKWAKLTGERAVCIPFCETAGEEVQKLIRRFSRGMYKLDPSDFASASQLHEYILQSNGFIIIAPVTRAPIFDGEAIEKEPPNLLQDPDVNIARLLTCVYKYKKRTGSQPIKAIGVVLTKYDLLMPILESKGMDLTKEEGVHRFMSMYFPQTFAVLKYYGIDRVKFFPSFVSLKRNQETGQIEQHQDGTPKIKVISERRIPEYSETSYINLVQWIRENFAS